MSTPDDHGRRSRSFRDALEVDDFEPIPERGSRRRRREATMPGIDPAGEPEPGDEPAGPEPQPPPDPEPEGEPVAGGGEPSEPRDEPAIEELPGEIQPERLRRRSETTRRALWAIPWAIFAVVAILAGGVFFAFAIGAVAILCQLEFFRMAAASRPFEPVAFGVTAALMVAAYAGGQYQMMYVTLAAIPLLIVAAVARGGVEGATASAGVTMLGIVWIGLALAHAILLRELPEHGAGLLLDVLIATVAADTAAYAGGRLLGRHRLAPAISPNKTVEGLVFGIVGGTLAFWFAGLYQDWLPGLDALAIGIVVALLAPLGDLFESLIKRDLGFKDSGNLVGPHGGLLDRVDALLFTVVAGYYMAAALL